MRSSEIVAVSEQRAGVSKNYIERKNEKIYSGAMPICTSRSE